MSDASFNQILSDAQNNLFQSGKVAAVRDAFNNTSYIFSTTQIRSLLNIVNAEADRLALAKLAYARAADPANYTAVYDMLPSQAARNDLDYYIRNNGNVVMSGSETVAVSAVSDAAFSAFKFDLKLKLFRSAKVAAVKDYINTSGNYFTVEQVKDLVGEGSSETDKIAIAKLAYKKTVDPTNYSQIVALIPSANGRADVTAYINANQ
jgi:anti-sigma28 factor (negative regulator of flagellin synthesis)